MFLRRHQMRLNLNIRTFEPTNKAKKIIFVLPKYYRFFWYHHTYIVKCKQVVSLSDIYARHGLEISMSSRQKCFI
jgi:hypothetical protein